MQLQYLRCSTFRGMERFWNENRLSLWYVLRNETVFRVKQLVTALSLSLFAENETPGQNPLCKRMERALISRRRLAKLNSADRLVMPADYQSQTQ